MNIDPPHVSLKALSARPLGELKPGTAIAEFNGERSLALGIVVGVGETSRDGVAIFTLGPWSVTEGTTGDGWIVQPEYLLAYKMLVVGNVVDIDFPIDTTVGELPDDYGSYVEVGADDSKRLIGRILKPNGQAGSRRGVSVKDWSVGTPTGQAKIRIHRWRLICDVGGIRTPIVIDAKQQSLSSHDPLARLALTS